VDILQRWAAKNPGRRVDDVEMRTVKPGSIVVPGMSGECPLPSPTTFLTLAHTDSHAHILEHGASLVIPLNQAQSAQGASLSSEVKGHLSTLEQMRSSL
jgi:hypothetical protein